MRGDWTTAKYKDFLDYIQPSKYLVKNTNYHDSYETPVLTAGKTFLLGYTNEKDGIFENYPVIIFDDFTTASKYVNFKFKAKSSAMKILKPTSDLVNLKYLFYSMQVNQINTDTHKRYWISIYSEHQISVPPLLEQKAIVQKIEQLFSELDNGVENLKKAKEKLKIYRQSVLKKAFEGELTKEWREKQSDLPTADKLLEEIKKERELFYQNQLDEWKEKVKEWEDSRKDGKKPTKPQPYKPLIDNDNETNLINCKLPINWAYSKLGETFEVYVGATPSRRESRYWNGNINWVSSGEVAFKKIFNTSETITEKGLNNSSTKVHPIGTILLAMIGEGKTRGQSGILEIEACHNQNTAALRVNQNYLSSKLLYYFFYYTYQETRRIGSGNNQKALNKSRISNMLMPLMSFKEQTQIVKEIESRLSVCDKIEETIESNLKKSESLRQSILKKAFEGKLLSAVELKKIQKHPEYESAEELLKRIQSKDKKTVVKKESKKAAKQSKPQKVSTDIHAGVIAKIIQKHVNNPKYKDNLTHVKCEKLSHLMEYHIGVNLGRVPVKDPAGPDDYPHLKKVEHRAKMAGYFGVKKQEIGHTYYLNKNHQKAIDKLESVISKEQNEKFDKLLNEFLRFDLESSEIIATLYSGWNNLLIDGKTPSDEEIVYESRENWSKRKLKIPRERFFKALEWMRKEEIALIPIGNGLKVEKPRKS